MDQPDEALLLAEADRAAALARSAGTRESASSPRVPGRAPPAGRCRRRRRWRAGPPRPEPGRRSSTQEATIRVGARSSFAAPSGPAADFSRSSASGPTTRKRQGAVRWWLGAQRARSRSCSRSSRRDRLGGERLVRSPRPDRGLHLHGDERIGELPAAARRTSHHQGRHRGRRLRERSRVAPRTPPPPAGSVSAEVCLPPTGLRFGRLPSRRCRTPPPRALRARGAPGLRLAWRRAHAECGGEGRRHRLGRCARIARVAGIEAVGAPATAGGPWSAVASPLACDVAAVLASCRLALWGRGSCG